MPLIMNAKVRTKWSTSALCALIAIYLALAALYSLVTPAPFADQHNPDEYAHYLYVQSIAAGHLPVFSINNPDDEAHQPPIYYVLAGPVYLAARRFGSNAAIHAVRSVEIVCGAAVIVMVYQCILCFTPRKPVVALLGAAFVGLLPTNVALSASISNDTVSIFVITVTLYFLQKIIMTTGQDSTAMRFRYAVLLGLLLGAGMWTKTLTLPMWPTVALTVLLMVQQKMISASTGVQIILISFGTGLIISSPWLVRNTLLYGDPLDQHLLTVTLKTPDHSLTADQMIPFFGGFLGYIRAVSQWSFISFWGGFDSMRLFWGQSPSVSHPDFRQWLGGIYNILVVICTLPCLGLCLKRSWPERGNVTAMMLVASSLLILCTAIAFLRYNIVFFQAQGRYWYPALPAFAIFFALGWHKLINNDSRFSLAAVVAIASLILLNFYTVFCLLMHRFQSTF